MSDRPLTSGKRCPHGFEYRSYCDACTDRTVTDGRRCEHGSLSGFVCPLCDSKNVERIATSLERLTAIAEEWANAQNEGCPPERCPHGIAYRNDCAQCDTILNAIGGKVCKEMHPIAEHRAVCGACGMAFEFNRFGQPCPHCTANAFGKAGS